MSCIFSGRFRKEMIIEGDRRAKWIVHVDKGRPWIQFQKTYMSRDRTSGTKPPIHMHEQRENNIFGLVRDLVYVA